jgi:hypothetical protein
MICDAVELGDGTPGCSGGFTKYEEEEEEGVNKY